MCTGNKLFLKHHFHSNFSGRYYHSVQPWNVRHLPLHRHHQLAPVVHPGGGRDKGQSPAGRRRQPQDGKRHDRHTVLRPPGRRRGRGRTLAAKVQEVHRAAKLNAAVIVKKVVFFDRGVTAKWISHTQP